MPSSSCGSASRPSSRRSASSRSRSGIRAASTWIVLDIVAPLAPSSDPIPGRSAREQTSCLTSDPECGTWRPHTAIGIFRFMAVATGSEYGLFINGEIVEAASGEHARRSSSPPPASRSAAPRSPARPTSTARSRPRAPRSTAPWGRTPPNERSRLLHALADAIVANRKELAELESRNVGKAISSVKAEVGGAVENFRFFASVIGSIAGRSNPIGGSLLTYSLKEPVGVAAQIVPWNYPLLMAVWKLSPALAAGCSVVLKPDPQTPLSVLRVAELATEVGFPAGAINIVPGDGPDDRRVSRQAPRRRQGRVHRLDEDGRRDHAALLRPDQAAHARARRQEPEPRLRGREPRRRDPELGVVDLLRRRPELRGALARARRGVRSTTSSSRASPTTRSRSASATRSTPRRRWARSSRRRIATACTASSSAAARKARSSSPAASSATARARSTRRPCSRRSTTRWRSRRRRSSARSSP